MHIMKEFKFKQSVVDSVNSKELHFNELSLSFASTDNTIMVGLSRFSVSATRIISENEIDAQSNLSEFTDNIIDELVLDIKRQEHNNLYKSRNN
jgi:hypothetical protein